MPPTFEQLEKPLHPLSPRNLYYCFLSVLLRTLGRLSDGIDAGFAHGFDSGMIMNYIYNDRAGGRFFVGRYLDRIFLDQVTCRAFRAIKRIQVDMMARYLRERNGRPAFIVDLASGKADYLYELFRSQDLEFKALLCDVSQAALDESRKTAEEMNLGDRVRFRRGDALDAANLEEIGPGADLVVEAGLYGIIHSDDLVREHLRDLGRIIRPDAILFNVQTRNPQIETIARVLENQDGQRCLWHLRPAERIVGWAEEAGFANPEIVMDPYNMYAVVMMRKTQGNGVRGSGNRTDPEREA